MIGPLARLLADQPGVSVVEQRTTGREHWPALAPAEEDAIQRALPARRREFAAGRTCARRALATLGFAVPQGVPAGPDRAPCWPPGVTGSITHTGAAGPGGYCAAAVARAQDLGGLGIDAEPCRAVDAALWPTVLREDERRAIERLEPAAQPILATVFFSAKESVYKATYPSLRQFLELDEVSIELAGTADERWWANAAPVALAARVHAADGRPWPRLAARAIVQDDLVVTAAWWAPLVD